MSLQTVVDAREALNIRAFEIWQGWAQEFEAVGREAEGKHGGRPRLPYPPRLPWMALLGALAVGALVGLRTWS